ncbi:MAG TPA: cytochrome c oxidase accessory protein CcoG [Bacteroidales bacterium]|nr:cytochrome c oxidase accessory protein CcoG [Bacteroidales bacterium]HPE57190.1 cytochrome c oxidase accessory protein CcoG [Bacteroidales bacterium]HRX96403.1 cytochrome c oxidase accessory protein CcoG [Bacteroidales bacterium]
MSEENKNTQGSFRDKLTTVNADGKRVWVYPKKPKGRLYNYRKIVAAILLLFLFVIPFIKYKGDPLVLLNVLERKFIIFGVIFWPQDFHLIVLSIISLVVFIILFTVVFGRIFCGWVCPQTIFMEFVFRQVEYWIEGDYNKQKKLARQEWNFEKVWKKSLKHIIFFTFAFLVANTFLAYLISIDELKLLITDGPLQHAVTFLAVVVFSGAFYFIFAFFREQVCTIACPYGRLQGVLLDEKSIVVAYDHVRGEPKGKHNPLEDRDASGKGDCIDCHSCVMVCPTNIDIRNGTQLECINCTACIDACDAVMDRIKRPRGLIRYDSEKGIMEGKKSIFTPRSIAYSVFLTALLILVGTLFAFRTDFETTILRQRGTLFQEYGDDSYSNIYELEVVNKTRESHTVELKLLEPAGQVIPMGDKLVIEKGEAKSGGFLAVLKKDQLKSSNTKLKFGIYSDGKMIDEYEVTFIGPPSLDK